jgi:hypothetical protein
LRRFELINQNLKQGDYGQYNNGRTDRNDRSDG